MKTAACVGAVTVLTAVATWFAGWWTVPIVALVAGLVRCPPGIVAAGCASGWLALLLIDFAAGSIGRVGGVLAGVMGLPAPALFVVTLAFPALLGWSAASLGNAALSLRPTSRPPS
jgi:hypothetical protein